MVYDWELKYLENWSTNDIKNQIWMTVDCHQAIRGCVSLEALRAELVRRGEKKTLRRRKLRSKIYHLSILNQDLKNG